MYRGFKITKETIEKILENKSSYKATYKKEAEIIKKEIKNNLEKYLTANNDIDVESLRKEWFPTKEYDIFLSHSHGDIDEIEVLAGYLIEEKGLRVFVDSFIWGYYDDLLKQLNNTYNQIQKNDLFSVTYNHSGANWCCSNVTIILNSALQEVIDNSEAIFFYNTPNSITHNYNNRDRTKSPWIFSEIETTRIIRKKIPQRIKDLCESERTEFSKDYKMNSISFVYWLEHNHLTNIDKDKFNKWIEYGSQNNRQYLYSNSFIDNKIKPGAQLDRLYEIVGE